MMLLIGCSEEATLRIIDYATGVCIGYDEFPLFSNT